MTLEERCSHVDMKLDETLQQNEVLSIRVESLEREMLDKEKLLLDHEAELSRLGNDLDWLVKDGIIRIVDKGEMVDAIDSFISCDYASMMNLGFVDIGGLRQLCADDENEGVGPSSNAKINGLDGKAGK
ncbi:unnamed protein product [Lactuca virosa]|uniref:Uncharacterized protein n=1 Tax=Lactuca virosa TaxID=75947 RepID=A0AAU9M6L8_9ASTR|nr:unnamed protein product [Lactuca virosa]